MFDGPMAPAWGYFSAHGVYICTCPWSKCPGGIIPGGGGGG